MSDVNITPEIEICTSRSGGKGGQHVNKVETQVEVRWHIAGTKLFTAEQIERLTNVLHKRMNKEGYVIVKCNEDRTQLGNKEKAVLKLHTIIEKALHENKIRKATKIPKAVKRRRTENKIKISEKKALRKKLDF